MPQEPRKKLYEALSADFDLGTFDEFNQKMDIPESRQKFYNSVSETFDLGTFSDFEAKIAGGELKKKETEGTPPPQQRVGSVTKLGGVQFGTPSVPSTSKQPSPSGGGVSPLPSAKFRPEDISKRVKETYARTTDVEDAIIPEVQLPKQGQTREMMFTKARDKFSRQFKEAEAALQEFQPIIQQAEMVQSGVEIDEDTKQQIIEQYNEALPQIQELQDIYSKSIDKVEYFDRALAGDRRLRAQDVDSGFRARFVESGLNQLGSLVANSLAGAARIAKNAYPQNMTALLTVAQEKFQQEGDKLKARAEFQSSLMDEKDNFANKDIADIYKQQGLVGAIDYASKKFTESVPITLGIMAASMTGTGGAVLANTALFGGTANQRYAELENRTDMSESEKVANALGYGTAELLFEGVLSTGLASVYKQMIKTMGKEAAEKAIRKTTIDVITNGVKKYMPLSGAAIEGIGEGATQFTQNFIDKVTDPTQKDKDLLEGVADATAIGSVGGTAMSTPASLSRVVGYLNRGESIKKNEELLKNRVAINTELQNAKSEETAQILQEKDAQLQEQQNDLVISDMKDMQESMSEKDKEVVKSLALKRDELIDAQNEVESEEVKKSIQKDIDSITSEIDKLYNLALSKEKTQDGTEPRAEQPATPPLVDEGGVVPTVTAPQVDSGVIEEGTTPQDIQQQEVIVNPTQGYSFEYKSEDEIPAQLRGLNPISKANIQVGAEKKVRLTFSGQQLIDAGYAIPPQEITPQAGVAGGDVVEVENIGGKPTPVATLVSDKKADIEKRLSIKLPAKNTSIPVSPKTWGDRKSLANQISSELKGMVERGVSMQEWLDKGYGRQLATWSDEVIVEFLEVADIERRRQEELDTNTSAGYGVIASDYLFTGGRGSMLSTDYLLQALTASFPFAGKQIDAIRNKYASKLGNISDDVNTKSYNDAIAEIREAINTTYQNSEIESLFDEILNNSTGFISREGNRVSSRLEALNEEHQNKINAKYDAELAALEGKKEEAKPTPQATPPPEGGVGQEPSPSVQVEGQPITSPQTEDFTPQQKEGAKPEFDIDISDIHNKKIVSNANRIRLSKEKTYIEKRSNSLKKLIDCIYG